MSHFARIPAFPREEKLILQALEKRMEDGDIELDVLQRATISNIDQKLLEKSYDVFHFIGHGVFENNQGFIALVDDNGKSKLLDDESFANFFLGNSNIGLVVLNSCQGAVVSSDQVFAGTAPNIVRRGIPAVVAMQYSILDSTAKLFADKFYRTLALGYPVDAAIQTTRNAISIELGLDKRDFATPVLYMRAKDGKIFDVKRKEEITSIEPINVPEPVNEPTNQFTTLSEVGADYTTLASMLSKRDFKAANKETAKIMLWIAQREKKRWLREEDIKKFPCLDLRTIDQLWLASSDGKFGFSVQKQIWIESGGKPGEWTKRDSETAMKFYEQVEWKVEECPDCGEHWVDVGVCWDLRGRRGHLPAPLNEYFSWYEPEIISFLAQRFITCSI